MKKVAVIMGSDSDWPVVKGACTQLDALNIPYEAHILSAHRTPVQAAEFAKSARERGFGVVICAAGMAAHLAGAFAANTTLPVIGIPMKGGALGAERRQKRRRAGRPDPGGGGRGPGPAPGGGPAEDGGAGRREGRQAPGGALEIVRNRK